MDRSSNDGAHVVITTPVLITTAAVVSVYSRGGSVPTSCKGP